ncbi:non-ribosomal peptide synthetase, partial [Chamaesiphon polymorphus]
SLPIPERDLDRLAFVIYTSGSTGQPKGVMVTHRGLGNLVLFHREIFQVTAQSRVLQFASLSFDASVWEIWMALGNGARLYLGDRDAIAPGVDLQQFLHSHCITHATLPPAALTVMPIADFPELQYLIVAGESCPPSVIDRWAVGRNFYNAYGPTETTVCATIAQCQPDRGQPPIGRPIAHTSAYLLDDRQQLVPVGIGGEIYLGGVNLARGYLNRPELTAEKFVPHPWVPGAKLYRTGDWGRYRADGQIEYLGRIDQQVKLRGFRIELGEVETMLGQHPDVLQTAVVARTLDSGRQQLVAYVVPQPSGQPSVAALREFMSERLPDYMVPGAFVLLPELPVTPNGKVDKAALPAPDLTTMLAAGYVAPQTDVEVTLVQIWQEVLGLNQVGTQDNFFAIGGDSILSLQVVARANQAGIQFTPKQLFAHQSIGELARVAGTQPRISAEQGIVTGAVPLTPIQKWFFAQQLPAPHHFNQAVLLEVPTDISATWLQQVLTAIVSHHDALRLQFTVSSDRDWHQQNAPLGTEPQLQIVDLSDLTGQQQTDRLTEICSQHQATMDLAAGCLVRSTLFRLCPGQPQRLLIAIHHLAVDGLSWRILLEDLQTAYQQLDRGLDIVFPAKTTAWQEWAQQLTATAEDRWGELAYWQAQSPPDRYSLPIDRVGENSLDSVDTVEISLSATATQDLLHRVPAAYRTQINDVLLSTLAQTIAEWTGESRVYLDLEGHGREELGAATDISRTVGWFTTLFPVCLDLPAQRQPSVWLKTIKEQIRSIPDKGIGYGLLRYICQAPSLVNQLTAPISFNYLGQFDRTLDVEGKFQLASESTGADVSTEGNRHHLLDISGSIVTDRLQLSWSYSSNLHDRSTIEHLAERFINYLEATIEHCLAPTSGGYTPSDFPLAQLSQPELDRLVGDNWSAVADIYPLSPMQQGMLFHSVADPDSGVYVELLHCTLHGVVDLPVFQQVWQQAIDRHDIFRTGFVWGDLARPLQVVRHQVPLSFTYHDWRNKQSQQAQLAELIERERLQGFDLSCPPLLRLHLIQLATDRYELVWVHHHLLLDGWSLPIVFKELFADYHASISGQPAPQVAVSPYRNYIAWLQTQDRSAAQAFWQEQLQGITAPTPLITDRHTELTPGYETRQLQLSIETTATLQEFVRQQHLTLSNQIQAAWALLLSRYSGETEVVFGVTVSGRPPTLLRVEEMVGLFINTLPVRVSIPSELSVLPWLQTLQTQQQDRERYIYTPLVDIQGWSEVPRGVPLFDSIVVFENYPLGEAVNGRVEGQTLEIANVRSLEQTNYPLTLTVLPGHELTLDISYDRCRFAPETIDRMLGHLHNLIVGMVSNTELSLSRLPLLSSAEVQQLQDWNATECDYPHDLCVPELFAQQVAATPDLVAVIEGGDRLTYRELAERANQLAHLLLDANVQPDSLVGICLPRSLDAIVAMLAVSIAGAAYVPLDPAYPIGRLELMLTDAQVPVLITRSDLGLPLSTAGMSVVQLDDRSVDRYPTTPPVVDYNPDRLAYIIYTSGSTGTPKGVMIQHRALVNFITAAQAAYQITSADRVLQFAAYSFDTAIEEIYPTLLRGATLVLRQEAMLDSIAAFVTAIESMEITVLDLPTAYWQQLVTTLVTDRLSLPATVRLTIIGGEQVSTSHVELWQRHCPEIPLLNTYGPTEATVVTTVADLSTATQISIGRPIANTQVQILDPHGQQNPIGVAGELHIGGAGLALGYLGQPTLTAAKFITTENDLRLYRSGDLARYLPDGQIEYLGRIDRQVKIRGFRIELGEIESVLSQHPQLQAVVVDRPPVADVGRSRLVAYYVLQSPVTDSSTLEAELRQFIAARLPDYMQPSAFVQLDRLPLTPSGKVDRQALPAPSTVAIAQRDLVLPTAPLEIALAQIWQEVLGLPQVGLEDNFFTIGGDSILSLQIIARANQVGIKLTFKQLFSHPSIGELVKVVETGTVVRAEQGMVTGAVPLTPIQSWFFEREFPEPHHFNQSVLLQVPADLDVDRVQRVLTTIVSHHDALRLTFTATDRGWQQFNAPVSELPQLQVINLGDLTGQQQTDRLTELCSQQQASLDLTAGCLLGATLFQMGAHQPQRLLIVIHHLAVDGVSWRILLADIQTALQQLQQGLEIGLPPKTTSWQQWCERSTELAANFTTELTYWQQQTRSQPWTLPLDRQGENSVSSSEHVSVSLSVAATQDLLQQVPAIYRTQINDVLLAALAQTISDWTQMSTIQLDLEGHGREELLADLDISRTVGWFTTLFPVCLDVSAQQPGLLLKSIKEQLRQIPHKGIGYGLLRYVCQEPSLIDLAAAPISFNYLGRFERTLADDGDFQLASESAGTETSSLGQRSHILDINAVISSGQLEFDWSYSHHLFDRQTIERLAQQLLQNLQALIDHCLEPTSGGYTPSDFPLTALSQAELDRLVGEDWRQVVDIYPLSPMQQGMLFHTVYAPESGAYVEILHCQLQGKMNIEAFEQAWQQTIDRHEIFRTSFAWLDLSAPVQCVRRDVVLPLVLEDWQDCDDRRQQDKLADLIDRERQQGFDLSRPPLMRLHLLQFAPDRYEFVWSHHHLLLDGWSLPIVLQDVFASYEAISQHQSPSLPATTAYQSYIAWLQQQDSNQAAQFWQQQLQGFTTRTPLPIGKTGDAGSAEVRLEVSAELSQQIEAFAREHQLTQSNLIQGAWALLLSRYSGERDVVFGVTCAGRPPTLPGVETIVGLFINSLPLRTTLPIDHRSIPWLKTLQAQQAATEAYTYTPLVDIQGWSDVPRGSSLFDSLVVFENYPVSSVQHQPLSHLTIANIQNRADTNYPLTLVAAPGENLLLRLGFDRSRFSADTVARMLEHCQQLLSGIVTQPEIPIAQLP